MAPSANSVTATALARAQERAAPCRILHLLGSGDVYNTSLIRLLVPLCRQLDRERFPVSVWFLEGGGPMVEAMRETGVEVRVFDWVHPLNLLPLLQFWRELRRESFQIIHQHFAGFRSRLVRGVARCSSDAAIILHLHGRVAEAKGAELLELSAPWAHAVITSSYAVAQQVRGSAAHVVYAGARISQPALLRARAPGTPPVIGTAVRLVPIKGVRYLVHAISLLREEFPGISVEIAGDGLDRERIQEEARGLNLNGEVRFLGWQNDLTPAMGRWDAFVLPSLDEGFGIAALEAMAAGLPVVTSDVGGLRELIEDGKSGRLVPAADAPALSRAIAEILANPRWAAALGREARQRVQQKFSEQQMVEGFLDAYRQILANRNNHH